MEVELESVSLTFSFMLRSHLRTIFSFLANTSFQADAVFFCLFFFNGIKLDLFELERGQEPLEFNRQGVNCDQ